MIFFNVIAIDNCLIQSGGKIQEAFYIFQELGEKYQWTSRYKLLSSKLVSLPLSFPLMMVTYLLLLLLTDLLTMNHCVLFFDRLTNGSAACQMQLGRYEDAERDLLEALSKDSKVRLSTGREKYTLRSLTECAL